MVRTEVARCSILVLSEDSAADAHATLVEVAKRMLRFIDPKCGIHRIRFEPPDNEQARRALRGNLWKSTNPREQVFRRALIGYIATKLLEGPASFVMFHVDGDRPWSARDSSENLDKFQRFIARDVIQFVEHRRQSVTDGRKKLPESTSPTELPSMDQLLRITPFYSIDSWLYQNTQRAVVLCRANAACAGGHVALLKGWERDRASLDEVLQPKTTVCFGAKHNAELAGSGFPTSAVYDARASFAETVDRMVDCTNLINVLKATRDP